MRPGQSLWRLPVYHSPQLVRGDRTYTSVRERGDENKRAGTPGCLTSVLESADLACVCCGYRDVL